MLTKAGLSTSQTVICTYDVRKTYFEMCPWREGKETVQKCCTCILFFSKAHERILNKKYFAKTAIIPFRTKGYQNPAGAMHNVICCGLSLKGLRLQRAQTFRKSQRPINFWTRYNVYYFASFSFNSIWKLNWSFSCNMHLGGGVGSPMPIFL